MSTIWLLMVMSATAYNYGTVTAVEFTSKKACIAAREEMKAQGWDSNTKSICVKKGDK